MSRCCRYLCDPPSYIAATYSLTIGHDLLRRCLANDRVEIIANDQGHRTTPSYVAFSESERLIGDAAKNQVAMNPANTVFDAKGLIGRKPDDAEVHADMKNFPSIHPRRAERIFSRRNLVDGPP
uniref:Heat shock protein 70 n=1 Tax=Mycena chlorophos TaxID=658473 RepID=A0ABQ0LMB9_MYCCL|nr:predicted protein [Mycena chlorophos]